MTQVSLFGDIPNDIQLELEVDNRSIISEDENREDEVGKVKLSICYKFTFYFNI